MKLEASLRLKATAVQAAPVTYSVGKKFLRALYENASFKFIKGLVLKPTGIEGFVSKSAVPKILYALKTAGFTKEWNPRQGANTKGLALENGTWPVVITTDKQGNGEYHVSVTSHTHDTINKGEKKLDMEGFKKISKDTCALLGVKGTNTDKHHNFLGYTVDVGQQATVVKLEEAQQKLKKAKYGKPEVTTKSTKAGSETKLTYKVGYANLVLEFSQNELYLVSVEAYK